MNKFFFLLILLSPFLNAQITDEAIEHYFLDDAISNEELFWFYTDWQDYEEIASKDVFKLQTIAYHDTLDVPYCYYIPPGYSPTQKTPMIVYLHGGVGRADFIDDPLDYTGSNPFITFAKRNNWFVLFPLGRNDLAWWKQTGMENINNQIIQMKENYNIDDDRIYLTGFSDGGSASFHFALTDPNLFASFYPMSGNAAVGNMVTGIPAYLPNLQNRHTRAINTDLDRLYPSDKMIMIMKLALDAGADLMFKSYKDIPHNFDYAENELSHTIAAMHSNPRQPFSPNLYWETSSHMYDRCDWLIIDSIDTLATAKDWHEHYSTKIPDDRLTFGIIHAEEYDGQGVKLKEVYDATPAALMGLLPQDIIIEMDGIEVNNIDELVKIRDSKQRGDEFQLTVIKKDDEERMPLDGMFPPITYYEVFPETDISGAIQAKYISNTFWIKTSRLSSFSILIHPNMVNMDIPLKVFINGEMEFEGDIEINRSFLRNNFNKNKDRSALWVNKLQFDLKK